MRSMQSWKKKKDSFPAVFLRWLRHRVQLYVSVKTWTHTLTTTRTDVLTHGLVQTNHWLMLESESLRLPCFCCLSLGKTFFCLCSLSFSRFSWCALRLIWQQSDQIRPVRSHPELVSDSTIFHANRGREKDSYLPVKISCPWPEAHTSLMSKLYYIYIYIFIYV